MPGAAPGKKKIDVDNYIYKYYQQIKDGTVTVGRWIRLLYDFLIHGIEDKTFFFDQKKADAAITWIENNCFHTSGPLAPGPFLMEVWQKAIVSALFGLVDENGLRYFRECLLVVGRKNGKSIFAASLARMLWRTGEFGTEIYTIAPKLDQAGIIYNSIWVMTTLDPEYQRKKELASEKDVHKKKIYNDDDLERHRMTDLYIPATNSTVKKIPFSAKRSDGYSPSLALCDEISAWEGDKGLKQYEVIKSGMGARPEGLILSCTTSGYVNDSIYDELIKRSTRFLLGDSKEKKLLPFLYMIDDVDKWNDINELRKSNPNLGVSVSVDYMLEEIAVAESSLSKKKEFIVKYANIKQSSSLALFPEKDVARASGAPLDIEAFRSSYAVAGLDLSQTRDLTAATLVIERDGELYVFAHFWLPAEKIAEATERDNVPYDIYIQRGFLSPSGENFVDYHDAYKWFVDLVEKYEIYPLKIGYDRYSSQYLCGPNGELPKYGFHCDDVYQGDNLYQNILELGGLFADGKIHIGDNDLLKIHLLNAAVKMSVERGRGKLVKISPSAHIDGTAALLDALAVRSKWYGEIGQQLKN